MNELISKISELFKKYGIKSITMDDIASQLGMSKKTLYQQYKNKKEVVYKAAQYEFQKENIEIYNLSISVSKTNVIKQLYIISKYTINRNNEINYPLLYGMNKRFPQMLEELNKQRKKNIYTYIEKNLLAGIEQGVYLKNIEIDSISAFYTFLMDIEIFKKLYF